MKFKKQFPILNKIREHNNPRVECWATAMKFAGRREYPFSDEDIQQYCLDKQKVKEIIKLTQELVLTLATKKEIISSPLNKKIRDKFKELGLE